MTVIIAQPEGEAQPPGGAFTETTPPGRLSLVAPYLDREKEKDGTASDAKGKAQN